MFRAISKWILDLLGWKITGRYPHELKKFIIIVIPHTSNWDFPLGVLVRSALRADAKFLAKNTLFRPPIGWFFRWLGGYPVERSKSHGYVESVVDIFNKEDAFVIAIAPEGTRGKVSRLKTGFYYIALGAKAPIVMIKLDYSRREVGIGEPFYPNGDLEADMRAINEFFKDARGKNPELGIDIYS